MSTALRMAVPAGGRLTVDLRALAENWRRLSDRSGPADCGAAVKADAYGIGLDRAAPALAAAGCTTFFVALPAEGARLRTILPSATIYVLNGYPAAAAPFYFTHRLRPVLGSREEISSWLADANGAGEAPAIHVDTGMHRLGLSLSEARVLAADHAALARLRPALVMSHLATADMPGHPLTTLQSESFAGVRALFPAVPGSLANSAAILSGDRSVLHDLTRPGIALYGGRWSGGVPPLATVATAEARIVQIREVAAGESVGYGATFVADRPRRIAILSAGYADGLHRALTDGEAAIGGRRVPYVGRISMDLAAVDVTAIDPASTGRGDPVELFGPTIPVDEVAARAGTIGYEILTGVGRRFERQHIG